MVGLNGSVATGEFNQNSDIDFLIVGKKNRIYTTRFFAAVAMKSIGWYRTRHKIAGRICLNCFLSEENLSIKPESKTNRQKVACSCENMIPLADKGQYLKLFYAHNEWINRKSSKKSVNYDFTIYKPRNLFEFMFNGKFGDWFEKIQRHAQSKRILAGKKPEDQIYLGDYFIKLHPEKISCDQSIA